MISTLPADAARRELSARVAEAGDAGAMRAQAERLFELQLSFNLFPAAYVHASWLESPGWHWCRGEAQASSTFWMRRMSAALLQQHGLDRQFDWDFSDRGKRLALLDSATLLDLGELAGAVLMRDRLRRLVRREDVQALQEIMGVRAYLYAVRWPGSLPALREAFFSAPIDEGCAAATTGFRQRCVALLAAAVPAAATGVRGRLQLKLPKRWLHACARSPELSEAQRGDLGSLLIAILGDIDPRWSWLFANDEQAWRAGHCATQELPC